MKFDSTSYPTNQILENVSLKPFNTFGIDVLARYFIAIDNEEYLRKILMDYSARHPILLLGGGSNMLFTKDFPGLVIKMNITGIRKTDVNDEHVFLEVGAGTNWHEFVLHCVKNNWGGVENLSLIPGTVGAAPIQNIGAYGTELKESMTFLYAIEKNRGETRRFDNAECQFGYRDSIFKHSHKDFIITRVFFRLNKHPQINLDYKDLRERIAKKNTRDIFIKDISDEIIAIRQEKLPDPAIIGNAGSFFKNPIIERNTFDLLQLKHPNIPHFFTDNNEIKVPAAWLIEQCGWKGKKIGNVGVHEKQPLVLINLGHAQGSEVLSVAREIQQSVQQKFGIELIPEVNIA